MQRPHYVWRRFLWRALPLNGAPQRVDDGTTASAQEPQQQGYPGHNPNEKAHPECRGVNLVQSVPLQDTDVQPRKGNCRQDYPFVVVLGRAEHDATFSLTTRILIALQQAYGASFAEWTPPLTYKGIAQHFNRKPAVVGTAMRALVNGGYVVRHQVSNVTGGQLYQYKLAAPRPGWVGLASVGENS